MPPVIHQRPLELFGHNTEKLPDKQTRQAFERYYCPFLQGECKKFRKSTPAIKIGTCTLGYQERPVIICPHRFETHEVFDAVRDKYFAPHEQARVKWIREVAIGNAGSVDFVAAVCGNGEVEKFVCVEFQAGGTTGTPWQAVEEFVKSGKFSKNSYHYGINWANQYLKTMMQQVLKKGKIINEWNQRIVFILQDVGMDYIMESGAGIEKENDSNPVHFFPFHLSYDENGKVWRLLPSEKIYSATLDGIAKILSGSEHIPSVDEFKARILAKGKKDGVLLPKE